MAARDRFTIDVKCPKCGVKETVRVSEDDYPFMRSPGFSVDSTPANFTYKQTGDSMSQTTFTCKQCNVVET